MKSNDLTKLREEIDQLNLEILEKVNKRGKLVQQIAKVKEGTYRYDPVRERKMLNIVKEHNDGPFEDSTIEHLFKQIFQAGLELQEDDHRKALLVSRKKQPEDTIIKIKNEVIGNGKPTFFFGPCAVESYEQVSEVAKTVKKHGFQLLRGGAYKPRTSPYDFQGLGLEGLKILKRVADEYDMAVISEIVSPSQIETSIDYIDVIQIGARNMQNFELLKAAGSVNKPVILKRGMSATIEEFINAAEYIMSKGNGQIILCERGIRTYERATRNTLDITSVPILKQETHLPVIVDVTHSTGRRDLLIPATKAALAIGADGVMAEVHPDPAVALSDSAQQMDLNQFEEYLKEVQK